MMMSVHDDATSVGSALHQISTVLLQYIFMDVATIGYHVHADSIIIPEIFQYRLAPAPREPPDETDIPPENRP